MMHRFLNWLIGPGPVRLMPTEQPEWAESDGASLAAYLRTAAGTKLVLLARFQEQTINASAVSRPTGCEYNCGYACGFRAAWLMIEKLSAHVPPHPDEDSRVKDGAFDPAERFAP